MDPLVRVPLVTARQEAARILLGVASRLQSCPEVDEVTLVFFTTVLLAEADALLP